MSTSEHTVAGNGTIQGHERPFLYNWNRRLRHLHGVSLRSLRTSAVATRARGKTITDDDVPYNLETPTKRALKNESRGLSHSHPASPRSRRNTLQWNAAGPRTRQQKADDVASDGLPDTWFSLHSKNKQLTEPIYISEVMEKSINPSFAFFDLEHTEPAVSRADDCIVRVWARESNADDWLLLLEADVNLRSLQFVGRNVDAFHHPLPPNCLLFHLSDGIYTAFTDLPGDSRSLAGREHKAGPREAASSFDGLMQLANLDDCIQDALKVRTQLEHDVNELLGGSHAHRGLRRALASEKEQHSTVYNALQSLRRQSLQLNRRTADLRAALGLRRAATGAVLADAAYQSRRRQRLDDELRVLQEAEARVVDQCTGQMRRVGEDLLAIFPIEPVKTKPLQFTIRSLHLPNSVFDDTDRDAIAAALGFTAQLVHLLSLYLAAPLPYPLEASDGNAFVHDPISMGLAQRKYALHPISVAYKFEYGVFLLNKDIEFLMNRVKLRALDTRHTLPNLKYLLYMLTAGSGELPARKAGGIRGLVGGRSLSRQASNDSGLGVKESQARRKVKCDLGPVDAPHDPPCARCRRENKQCLFATERRKAKDGSPTLSSDGSHVGSRAGSVDTDGRPVKRLKALHARGQGRGANLEADAVAVRHGARLAELKKEGSSNLASSAADQAIRQDLSTTTLNHFGDLLAAAETLQADDVSERNAQTRRMMAISLAGGPPPAADAPMSQLDRHYHDRALHAWRHMRLVRAGWFTAEEAMAYMAHFATYLQPMTPTVIGEYLHPRKHPELLMNEPVLTVSILLVTSRHVRLQGHSHQTRAFLIHEALWNYLRSQIQRLMWAQEQFGGGFTGAGASDVREGPAGQIIWQGSLRTLGTVEALLLLSDWQPRGLHFPPGNDDDLLLGADYQDSELTNGHADQEQASGTLQSVPYAAWLEPVWRSDKMSWMILGIAQALAFELGVFDRDLDKMASDPERQRKLRLRKLVLIYVSQTSGRIGIVPSPLILDDWARADGRDDEPVDKMLGLWFDIAHIMNHVNRDIFPSKEYTRDIIINSKHRKLIAEFTPRLVRWKERFDADKAFIGQVMQAVLLMEYEYARLYLNSLGFQSVVSRLLSDNDSQRSMLVRSNLVAENKAYIDELTEAASNILDRFTIDLGDGGLINAPVRTFLRNLSAMMFAMKRLSLGADEKVVRRIIEKLDRATIKLGKEVVDDVHLSSQMSRLMHVLVDKVKNTLIRVERATNTSNAASRDLSHSASPHCEAEPTRRAAHAENDPAMTLPQVSSALAYGNHDPLAGIPARPMTDLQDKTFVPPPNYNMSTQEYDFDDQILNDNAVDASVISGDPGDWFAADIGNIWNSPLAQADQGAHSIGPTVGNRDWIELVHGNLGGASSNSMHFPLDTPTTFHDYQATLWGAVATSTASSNNTWCTPLILPTGGIIVINDSTITISGAKATFKLPCDSDQSIISPDTTGNSSIIGFSGPFYSSISPQIYALATATVISYVLVILIFITPRTFYVGGPSGGGRGGYLSRGGLLPGIGSSNSVIGVGRRPLLQKIATVAVAASLTIASADTFNVAESQYYQGYIDSSSLVDDVVNSLEIRIVQVISDTFLWLAQVQTLIRLFPRHREKVAIKWLGFAMVTCDTVFSVLDSFVAGDGREKPRSTQDAIPALNYLFDLAIALIYASCVVYYSLSKRRFAFWHPKMRNICLVALISYLAIAIPVVFFILDVSLPDVAGWGEYIRWVGAAAASVVVWEWVERIETLERDERKDGILGREIFDGDEMLDLNLSDDGDSRTGRTGGRRRRNKRRANLLTLDVEKGPALSFANGVAQARAKLPLRRRRKLAANQATAQLSDTAGGDASGTIVTRSRDIAMSRPANAITPPSRSDTASAASTVYAVRYHNLTSPSPAIAEHPEATDGQQAESGPTHSVFANSTDSSATSKEKVLAAPTAALASPAVSNTLSFWPSVFSPFKRRRAEPPAEVAGAQIASGLRRSPTDRAMNLRERLGGWSHGQLERLARSREVDVADLPVTVIPAPRPDGRTWSPDEVAVDSSQCDSTEPVQQDQGQDQDQQPQPQPQATPLLPAGSSHPEPSRARSEHPSTATLPRSTVLFEASPNTPSRHSERRKSTAHDNAHIWPQSQSPLTNGLSVEDRRPPTANMGGGTEAQYADTRAEASSATPAEAFKRTTPRPVSVVSTDGLQPVAEEADGPFASFLFLSSISALCSFFNSALTPSHARKDHRRSHLPSSGHPHLSINSTVATHLPSPKEAPHSIPRRTHLTQIHIPVAFILRIQERQPPQLAPPLIQHVKPSSYCFAGMDGIYWIDEDVLADCEWNGW
ncbi:hypothetical protein DV737_g892, partial [Chaetothyriales sp. CBS 132003]